LKTRRHHNNRGIKQIKSGRTAIQVKHMASRLRKEDMGTNSQPTYTRGHGCDNPENLTNRRAVSPPILERTFGVDPRGWIQPDHSGISSEYARARDESIERYRRIRNVSS
jgi:hypothetical protein